MSCNGCYSFFIGCNVIVRRIEYNNKRGGISMIKKSDLPECPVATTVQLIGSKWKLLILRHLLSRPYRFNELQKSLEGISHKVLSESLNAMIHDGLIVRKDYQENPPHVEYALSSLGESMKPIMSVMEE